MLPILMILLVLFQAGGFFVVFKVQQSIIRKEVKQAIKKGVDEKNLVSIFMDQNTNNEIVWKNSHEFMLNGRMYDVVRTEKVNGTIKYLCLDDNQETELFKKLDKQTDNEMKNTNNQKHNRSLFSLFGFIFDKTSDTNFHLFRQTRKIDSYYLFAATDWTPSVPTAPPCSVFHP